MPAIAGLVVKVVQRCNLNCTYCYMYNHADQSYLNRPRFMSRRIFRRLVERVEEYCQVDPERRVDIVFHGGEPMLMSPARFDDLASYALDRLREKVSLGLQSNATLVTDGWVRVLQKHQVKVGVSVDGPPELHDRNRVTHSGAGSSTEVVKGLRKLQEGGVFSGTLTVITPGVSGLETYRYLRSLGVTSMDFLLPDCSHDAKEKFYPDCGPTPVADFLLPVFDAWYQEDDPSVSVRIFVDIIRKLLKGEAISEAVGNRPENYLVIDTDGTIQANDALKVTAEGIPESGLNVLSSSFEDLHAGLPLVKRLLEEGLPLATQCQTCAEREVCGGGTAPNRFSVAKGFDNPSIWCRDLLGLIGHIRRRVFDVAA